MLNRDLYNKAPQDNRLANQGVAEVAEDHSQAAQAVLRYELSSFVCDGQYSTGLQLILEHYLRNLDGRSDQPGIWISGFFGSGKSHLAKMLRYLWTDHRFEDGATARNLADLPSGVYEHLKELSQRGKQHGGLHAAAGKLGAGAGNAVRMALLGIVYKSKGLPEAHNQARLVLWLKREGLLASVEAALKAQGRQLAQELPHMYVSDPLAQALMAAQPGLAHTPADLRKLLKEQYPQVNDVSTGDLIRALEDALQENGRFPLTLIVLDEVQQYIGQDVDKTHAIQEVSETLSKHFQGRLLLICTGQSALSETPNLQRILGRFSVPVTLSDLDVENVTRQIILAKKPTAKAAVDQVWQANLGEISRHLRSSTLAHRHADEALLTADYPLLPVRRRFWDHVLKGIDTTGTVSQLRSQLRVVHEAVLATADLPLGQVVAGDFLYDQIADNLLSSGQVPKEVFEKVRALAAGDESSQLKGRLLKLIFMINKLPAEMANQIGLRATAEVLADLLVTDLAEGSSALRGQLPNSLDQLVNQDRVVMALEGAEGLEYRLQTRESSAWHEEFRAHEQEWRNAPQRVDQKRADLLKERFRQVLGKVVVKQGQDNVKRELNPTFDERLPKDHATTLGIWVQDGWQSEEKSVLAEARSLGTDNPTLLVFLPAQNKTQLTQAIVHLEAANSTLLKRGEPSTEEGREAQRAMKSRHNDAQKALDEALDGIMAQAKVFQAGGQEAQDGRDLAERIATAAKASATRLYPQFDVADHGQWGKVLEEARKGNLEALKAVGHHQEADKHPVCQRILAFVGLGKKGSELREHFEAPPHGWPKDAIEGALYALLATGHLKATNAAGQALDAKSLDRAKITQSHFQRENVHLTPVQLIKIRTLFKELGLPCQPHEESQKLPQLLQQLRQLAAKAGGPAPAPEAPQATVLDTIEAASGGNAQLQALLAQDEALKAHHAAWLATTEAMAKRLPAWHQLQALLPHASGLPDHAQLQAEVEALLAQRSLLAEPDPVRPLLDRCVEGLRQALRARCDDFTAQFEAQRQQLLADPDWQRLPDAQRQELSLANHLDAPTLPELGTPDEIKASLTRCNLAHWEANTQALASRFEAARHAAVMRLKPNALRVTLPKRTLNNVDELTAWLGEVESLLRAKLQDGPVAL